MQNQNEMAARNAELERFVARLAGLTTHRDDFNAEQAEDDSEKDEDYDAEEAFGEFVADLCGDATFNNSLTLMEFVEDARDLQKSKSVIVINKLEALEAFTHKVAAVMTMNEVIDSCEDEEPILSDQDGAYFYAWAEPDTASERFDEFDALIIEARKIGGAE
jgi:hypothetical protein